MAIKTNLKDFIKKHVTSDTKNVGALSFDEYKAGRGLDYDDVYSRGISDAYTKLASSDPYYGAKGESLYQSGLSGSGYAEYLGKKSKGTYESTLRSLYEQRAKSEARAKEGYASYLSEYESGRASLMKSVRGELIKNSIINPDTAYNYAISAGLTESEANTVTKAVYDVSRERIMAEIIAKAASLQINGKAAETLAIKMGLTEEDSLLVREEVEKYLGDNGNFTVPEGYLDELEDKADHLTTTIKNKKGN